MGWSPNLFNADVRVSPEDEKVDCAAIISSSNSMVELSWAGFRSINNANINGAIRQLF